MAREGKEAVTERTAQEELEEIFTALNNLLERDPITGERYSFYFPPDSRSFNLVISPSGGPESLRVILDPTTDPRRIFLAFEFDSNRGVTSLEVMETTEIPIQNKTLGLSLARKMFGIIQARIGKQFEKNQRKAKATP